MRSIEPTELTKAHRNADGSVNKSTYSNASYAGVWNRYWLNPMLNSFNGIVMHELIEVLIWSNRNIFVKINSNSLNTLNVYVRIVTGMLNKIEYLTDAQKQQLHSNLIQFIRWLQTEYIVADLRNSPNDLPF